MGESWRPLVSMSTADGIVAVCADEDGGRWLTSRDPESPRWHGGTGLGSYEPAESGGLSLLHVGGLVPENVATVLLLDAEGQSHPTVVGGGAWVGVMPLDSSPWRPPPAVLFRDATGAVVPRPFGEGELTRTSSPLIDPCPACGGTAWDRVTHRGPYDDRDRSSVICRRCGHALRLPTFFAFEENADDVEEAEAEAAPDLDFDRSSHETLAGARFPIYDVAAPETRRSLVGSSASGLPGRWEITQVRIGNPDRNATRGVVVSTGVPREEDSLDDAAADAYREALYMQDPPDWPDASEEEITFFLARNEAAIVRRLRVARRRTVAIRVDGRPLPFLRLGDEQAWAAAGHVPCDDGESFVVVTLRYLGDGHEELSLRRVTDPTSLARDDD